MARSPEGPPPPPVVQRIRLRYAKRGRLRFTSHRDFQRVFERAVRRAGVPVAFSAGFSPHPKISYAGASPTGVASEAEYLEIGLARACDPEAVRLALDRALPDGLDVLDAVEAGPGALADRIDTSLWRVELPGLSVEALQEAVAAFLAADEVTVERLLKDGRRLLDARAPVAVARVLADDAAPSGVAADAPGGSTAGSGACAILQLVVRHTTPAVRPDDILTGLRQVAPQVPPASAARVTRLAQGLLDAAGQIAEPLAPDHAAGSPAVVGAQPTG